MAYVVDIANRLVETLEKLTTLNAYQLAGHAANLDFWVAESRHCLEVLDGYNERFECMKAAQTAYVKNKDVTKFDLDLGDFLDFGHETIAPPRRAIKDSQLKELRRSVSDAAHRFIVRCYKQEFIDEVRLRQLTSSIGVAVELADLRQ